jgi:predicted RNase H-like nuclease (RuvC/YqgF family)
VAANPEALNPEPPKHDLSPRPESGLSDLSAELRALQESARKADALAAAVERRIEELEDAAGRAERLERELKTAQQRIAELEQRLSNVDTAADELRATTEKLQALSRLLDTSTG